MSLTTTKAGAKTARSDTSQISVGITCEVTAIEVTYVCSKGNHLSIHKKSKYSNECVSELKDNIHYGRNSENN